jgi:dsDNA-specific endonuclease/ATPase MutS2
MADDADPVRIPITGELDLHTFRPAEAASVVEEYLAACRGSGLTSARIVHGKGTGALRATVHAALRRSPIVKSFRLGDETSGGWGSTVVQIKQRPK